jgi:NADH:ubiquinone oxidoreductase subunit 2 (subunit N)
MSDPSLAKRMVEEGLLVGGLLFLLVATVWAIRPRRAVEGERVPEAHAVVSRAFTWIVIAGLSYPLLGLAAAVRAPASAGLTAALLQLLSVLLAAALGAASLGAAAEHESPRRGLATAGLLVAWLSLVGLPPALGFHAKILIYRSLLSAGWGWAAVAAMAGSFAALVPAFLTATLYRPPHPSGVRVLWIALLLAALLILGLYPQAGIGVVTPAASLAAQP